MPTYANEYKTANKGFWSGQFDPKPTYLSQGALPPPDVVYAGSSSPSVPYPTAPTPAPIATPSAPSVPGTGRQSYLAAAIKQKAPAPAPVAPPAPTFDFSADAQRGTDIMNLKKQVAAMSAQAGPMVTTGAAGVNYSPTTYGTPNQQQPLTNAQKLAGYTPELVQGAAGGNDQSYSITNAGLTAPDPNNYTDAAAYMRDKNAYGELAALEQDRQLGSENQRIMDDRNAQQEAIANQRRQIAAAEDAQRTVATKNRNDRTLLINQLASRGIDPNTDTWAMGKLNEADKLDQQEQQAAASMASVDLADITDQAKQAARNRLAKTIADIQAQKTAMMVAGDASRKSRAEEDLLLAQAEKEKANAADITAYSPGKLAAAQALADQRSATADYTSGAKTENTKAQTDYTSGAKTDLARADIRLKDANTDRITTLTPFMVDKLKADIAKALRPPSSGGGGGDSLTPEEALIFQAQLDAGVTPTKASVKLGAQALKGMTGEDVTAKIVAGKTKGHNAVTTPAADLAADAANLFGIK